MFPMNYEENQWRQEVTRGGWAILSPPDSFLKLRRRKEKERGEICPAGGWCTKSILAQRLRLHSELFANASVEVKNKSTMRYLAQSHSGYVTNSNS